MSVVTRFVPSALLDRLEPVLARLNGPAALIPRPLKWAFIALLLCECPSRRVARDHELTLLLRWSTYSQRRRLARGLACPDHVPLREQAPEHLLAVS